MMQHSMILRPLLLAAACARSTLAALPYIPTTALRSENSSVVFIFRPSNDFTSASLISLNATSVTPNSPITTVSSSLPFLSEQNTAFTPFVDSNGTLYAVSGQCSQGAANTSLWTLKSGQEQEKGDWVQAQVSADTFDTENPANAGGVNYLAAGFAFSSPLYDTPTLYSFGGMCPNDSISSLSTSTWQSSANYSNSLISLVPQGILSSSSFASVASKDDQYKLSPVLSSRGPPIPEAGFSATSLTPLIDGPNDTSVQQNIVLIGGQTAEAFLNMSQIAMMSLPEQSWSFIPIDGAGAPSAELIRRQSPNIEPRSGHTAVLSADGTQIVVLGGWVGDTNTPAEPQLAILNVGQDYGGRGGWQWSVPNVQGVGFAGNGIYGHGATLLPGNVMMIVGGTSIMGQGSKAKRDAMGIHFLNITTNTWSTSYDNPLFAKAPSSSQKQPSSGLHTGQKVGLGVGLGVGIPLFLLLLALVFIFRIRKKRKDRRRSDLIDRALNGSENFTSEYPMHVSDSPQAMVESRPASQLLPQNQFGHSREPSDGQGPGGWRNVRSMEAERTGLLVEIPSPTRGLRRGHSRGNSNNTVETGSRASGQIPVIDEIDEDEPIPPEDEHQETAAIATTTLPTFELPELDLGKKFTGTKSPSPRPPEETSSRPLSDPFADPPILPAVAAAGLASAAIANPFGSAPSSLNNTPNETSEREGRGWIEDWEAVRTRMVEEREQRASARSIAQHQVVTERVSPLSHRTSPKSSDRTESSVSERSMHSAVSFVTNKSARSSNPSLARNMSQRSSHLFTVLPGRIQRKPIKPPRRSLPQAGTVSTAVTAIQGTPPNERSPPGTSRSVALSTGAHNNSPDRSGQPRMPSFGTLQAESQALLGQTPRSAATPMTHLDEETNIEGHMAEYVDDEFPQRPNQRRSRGLVGSMRNVLSGRGRMRLNTVGSVTSSVGSPTVATVSSGSPTRASTATPFSMLRTTGDALNAATATGGMDFAAAAAAGSSEHRNQASHRGDSSGAAQRSRPRRTASVGSAPWRRRQSGARDWDWHQSPQARAQAQAQSQSGAAADNDLLAPPPHGGNGKHSSSSSDESSRHYWRRSSPGAATTGSIRDDLSERSGGSGNGFGGGGAGGDWDVESAVERRCVQVMFTVPRERLRVVNAVEGEVDAASVRTRPSAPDISGAAVATSGAGAEVIGRLGAGTEAGGYDDDDIASYYQQARSVSGGTQHTYSLRKNEAEEEMRLRGGGSGGGYMPHYGGYHGGYHGGHSTGAGETEPMPTAMPASPPYRCADRLAPTGRDVRYSPGRGSPGLW